MEYALRLPSAEPRRGHPGGVLLWPGIEIVRLQAQTAAA
jgi:hypothetical protein